MIKRQFVVLFQDSLRRIIDLDVLSVHARGDASTLIGQVISLLIFLSLLFAVPAIYFSGKLAMPGQVFLIEVWSLQHFLIATTMLLVGLFAVLSWNSVFPDKRDLMILAPLPIRTRTLFLARIAAVGTALALLVITLHLLAGVVWPFAFNRYVPQQMLTEFASQPALAPVTALNMKAMLDRDFEPLKQSGALVRGGVSIGIMTRGARQVLAYGAAKPDSIFEIGSVTKAFTALTLAQMVQQGLVKLDEPVRDLLPPGTVEKPYGSEITLLDLATHHSGLPRMPQSLHLENNDNPSADFGAVEMYEYMAKHGVKKPADASFLYSNLGVGLLGQLLADRAQMNYADLVKTKVTDPLGLTDTVVVLSPEQRSRLIQGYNGFNDGPDGFRRASHSYGDPVPPITLGAIAGAGAEHSTAGDLLRFLEENLHPKASGGALAAALVESHRAHADMADSAESAGLIPLGTRIALIWWQTPDGCYLHGGATPGYTAAVMFHPRGDWALTVLSNMGPGSLLLSDLIAAHIRQRIEGLPALSLAPVRIPASGGLPGLLRLFVAYWITIVSSGVFIYCSVLAVQGITAGLLPRQWYLRTSSFLQMTVFCLLVSVYFLQPSLAAPNLFDPNSTGPPIWSPSFWFLGLFQQLNGSPALASYAARAWIGLAVTVSLTTASYVMCYFRSLRDIIEQPDIKPGAQHQFCLPRFGKSFETAVVQFSVRTLLRSRQHRIILAFYLGIGFGATVFLLKSPVAREISKAPTADPWHEVSAPLLAASIILLGFWVVGMRAVFSLPIELPANWIFRMSPLRAGSSCISALRRSLWVLAVAPGWSVSAAVFLTFWPWKEAAMHLALLAAFGLLLTELCLQGNQKLPFTCSWLPGKSNLHIVFWMCITLVLEITLKTADFEIALLRNELYWTVAAAILATLAAGAALRTSLSAEAESLTFEEIPSWQLTTLNLSK